jgi:hypothetical protein
MHGLIDRPAGAAVTCGPGAPAAGAPRRASDRTGGRGGATAYHGGLGALTGGRVPLGDGVLVPAPEIVAVARPASAA